jgi:hypothetical protein
MRSLIRTFATSGAVVVLAAACSAAATPTPSATTGPTVAPVATTDAQGDEYVVGTQAMAITTAYTPTVVGDVTQYRGGVLTITDTTNDARVSGTATYAFSVDAYTKAGPEWGSFKLQNANGSWQGSCTGASWNAGNSWSGACWLAGSGSYAGYTYYRFFDQGDVQGIIYKGLPPTP